MLMRICALALGAALFVLTPHTGVAEEADEWRNRINKGTVGVISGGIGGTYIRIATDLASVLDEGYDLRVLPMMGKGSVQNIDDILYLKGIDLGIVQSDVLSFIKREGKHPNIENRIGFITKLYNEEFHLMSGVGVSSVEDLAGKKVNFGVAGSGTFMTATLVFETLGVEVEPVSLDQGLALEKIKSGEIAATVYVAGKPAQAFRNVQREEGLKFLEIPFTPELLETYLPAQFGEEDYPQIVPAGEKVRTIAVGAVMAVYNWQQGSQRYFKVKRFIDTFFGRFEEFQRPPRHAKWQEVSLSAEVPGWTRFEPAQTWLDQQQAKRAAEAAAAPTADSREAFERFLAEQAPALADHLSADGEKEKLFELFTRWRAQQTQ